MQSVQREKIRQSVLLIHARKRWEGNAFISLKWKYNFLMNNSCMINSSDNPLRNGFNAASVYGQEHLNAFVGLLNICKLFKCL